MKNSKRILAMLGVVILVLLYITTLVAAIFSSPSFTGLFTASVYCTIIIPVMLYAYMLIYKLSKERNSKHSTLDDKQNKKH